MPEIIDCLGGSPYFVMLEFSLSQFPIGERESIYLFIYLFMDVYRFPVAMNSLISSLSIFVTGNIISKVIITALMNDFSRQIR